MVLLEWDNGNDVEYRLVKEGDSCWLMYKGLDKYTGVFSTSWTGCRELELDMDMFVSILGKLAGRIVILEEQLKEKEVVNNKKKEARTFM